MEIGYDPFIIIDFVRHISLTVAIVNQITLKRDNTELNHLHIERLLKERR